MKYSLLARNHEPFPKARVQVDILDFSDELPDESIKP
jgi:hypothetical protein